MADMNFEEQCPCGASIKVSGFESRVTPQVQTWHRTHDKHANAIAKSIAEGAIAEKMKWPIYYIPPLNPAPLPGAAPWWQNPTITFSTTTGGQQGVTPGD